MAMLDKTHHFPPLNRLGLPWDPWAAGHDSDPFQSLREIGLPRSTSGALAYASDFPVWKSVEICGMLDLSGSISLAHPNAEARCPVHVSRYRGIAHLSGGDYGKTTRSSHFTKDAVQKF